MYFIKESLAHCPIIMMAKTGTAPRYIAIADPDLIECVPPLRASMRSADSPAKHRRNLCVIDVY